VKGLNPGIRRTVKWLNENGFPTTDSGDGKTHDYGCDRPFPYVVIRPAPDKHLEEEADALMVLLEQQGVKVMQLGVQEGAPWIQASYDPTNGIGLIDLANVDDALLFPARPKAKRKTRRKAK
jgi:hypothetical protein